MTLTQLALELLQARREYEVARYHNDAEAMDDAMATIEGITDDVWTMNFTTTELIAETQRLELEGY